ncbi:MAG TPA: amidase [Actinomycetes bacterium]|nr:amidase [Actinomycetes bacterium]
MAPGELAQLADAVRRGQVTAADLVAEALRRIDALDPELNAVVARCDDEAERVAHEIDAAVARGEDPGPLAGIPVLVKDLEDVAGMITTQGSLLLTDSPPASAHSTVPRRLTAAGAVIVGKSNLPEFATEGYTDNLVFGVTRNPWQPDYSPGGSSGGSAAALASGMIPIATATDGGGSIRIPAAFCALVGLKPTHGLIGRWPAPDWIDLSTEGPFATCAADLALLWQVMSGPEAGDPGSVPRPVLGGSLPDVRRVFAIGRFASDAPLPDAIGPLFEAAVHNMAEMLGVPVQPVSSRELWGDVDFDDDWFTVATAEHIAKFGREWVERGLEQMHPGARGFMEWGLGVDIDKYLAARRRRFDGVRALDALLGDDGVLLSPVNAAAGWLADGRMQAGDEPGMLPAEVFNTPFTNITSHPTLSLPAGVTDIGVPFGLQVIGPRYSDELLLELSARWEQEHPWPRVAPGYRTWADEVL